MVPVNRILGKVPFSVQQKFSTKKKPPLRYPKLRTQKSLITFEENKKLAFYMASRYWETYSKEFIRNSMDLSDVRQETLILLNRAVETYDPKRGSTLNTHMSSTIKHGLLNLLRHYRTEKRFALIESLDKVHEDRKGKKSRLIETIASPLPEESRLLGHDINILGPKLLQMIKMLNISKKKKVIFIDLYGLEDRHPKTLEETAQRYSKRITPQSNQIKDRDNRRTVTRARVGQIKRELIELLRKQLRNEKL